jgi:chitodextrinase
VNAVDGATPAHEGQLSVAASATTTSVPDTTPPSQVTNVIATATNSSSIRVTWSAATDPGSPTTGIQGYIVYRNGVRANTPLVVGLFFDDTGRAPSTTYSYRVSAVDGATPANEGQQSDVASATTSATPDTTAPNLVTGLVATGTGPNQITLSWIANTESDLKGYLVYCGSEPDPVATVFAPLTSFIHTGLTPSTTYSYRVSAVDTATPQNEGPLAEVTATTLPTTMPTPSAPTNLTRGPLLPEDRWREWDAYDLYWTDYCNLDLNWGRPANYVDLPGEIITFTIAYGNHFEVHRATQSLESALTFNVTIDNALVSAPVSDPWYFCITPKHGETVGVSAKIGVYASSCATFVVSTLTGCP